MADFWERETAGRKAGRSLKDRLEKVEEELSLKEMKEKNRRLQEKTKIPRQWRSKLKKGAGRRMEERVLVFWLNVKGELEVPKILPIFSGSIIIYKNKPYEFDPRAMLTVRWLKRKVLRALILREIDRRPVSNLDINEVKARGDSTDSDEILVKLVTRAVIEKAQKQIRKGTLILVILGIIAAIGFFMFS